MKKRNIKMGLLSVNDGSLIGPFERCQGFSEGLAAAEAGGKYGYIDTSGKFVIQPQFEEASYFSEGWAVVEKEGKKFYISREGEKVLEPEFEDFGHFSEGLAWFEKEGKYGYMDKTGNVVIQPVHESFDLFSRGFATADLKTGKIIDKSGNEAIPPQQWFESFANDESIVYIPVKDEKTGLFGYVESEDEENIYIKIIVNPQFEDADFPCRGIARVKKDGLYGYLKLPSKEWLAEPSFADGDRHADESGFLLVELP